ncbi:hypothetical protein RCH20_001767 [Psychrobacter sp. PL15]|uniref:DUF3025 domain-containing protein n=1 Tax=Psychrobacter sp. PL15 TaxID=3071719 RepID=UPI002DF73AAF|nr:hypothetical protein [Psychrobacter sp. PL15]
MTVTAVPSLSSTTVKSNIMNASLDVKLDASLATIDWQAPWLSHLSQLSYLSQTVASLSKQMSGSNIVDMNPKAASTHMHNQVPSHVVNQISNYSTTVIANLLNIALAQQADSFKQPLPQTKPTQNNQAQALQFMSQDALPEGEGYESFIATTGHIPTRDNLHDLFNGSIWLTFPKTKALLNYYHMCEIAKQMNGKGSGRGRVRDTITVFDENGAILVTADPSIGEALINFDWQGSLVKPRDSWDNLQLLSSHAQAAVYIFGHALLEQLIQPRKSLCAHSIVINVSPDFFTLSNFERLAYIDDQLAHHMQQMLSQTEVTPRNLAPLPVLGVPHFWPDNADVHFYDDHQVFRSGRRKKRH